MKIFFLLGILMMVGACQPPPPTPMTWPQMIVRIHRDMGLRMMIQIRAAPHPAAAKELLAPAIRLLIRGQLYKEARRLAGTAINAFPSDPLYHQLLGEAYQATLNAGLGSARTQRKMEYEFNRAQELSRQ